MCIRDRVYKGLAHVPEGRRIFQQMTVLENLEMGAYLHKKPTREEPVSYTHLDVYKRQLFALDTAILAVSILLSILLGVLVALAVLLVLIVLVRIIPHPAVRRSVEWFPAE